MLTVLSHCLIIAVCFGLLLLVVAARWAGTTAMDRRDAAAFGAVLAALMAYHGCELWPVPDDPTSVSGSLSLVWVACLAVPACARLAGLVAATSARELRSRAILETLQVVEKLVQPVAPEASLGIEPTPVPVSDVPYRFRHWVGMGWPPCGAMITIPGDPHSYIDGGANEKVGNVQHL